MIRHENVNLFNFKRRKSVAKRSPVWQQAHIEEELENDVTVEFMKCNQCSYKIKWNRSTTPMLGMLHNKLISNKIPLSD